MFRNILCKVRFALFLVIIFYVPVGVAAPIVELFFDATILERTATSPLALYDNVTGGINIDSVDHVFGPSPDSTFPNLVGYGYDGSLTSTTFGYANKTPFNAGDWSTPGPVYDVFLGLGNNYALTPGDVSDFPSYVLSPPPVGSVFDLVEIDVIRSVNGIWGLGGVYEEFSLLFAFDPIDNVVSGLTLGDVDFTKLFTHAVYTEFSAELNYDDGSEDGVIYWEAFGPLTGGSVSAVPIPAAVWLLGSGLLGLFGFARKRHT